MTRISRTLAYLLAGATGYLSLSQEILWIRVIGSANDNRPETFATGLGFFLLGLAFGGATSRGAQRQLGTSQLRTVAVMVALSSIGFFWTMPIGAAVLVHWEEAGRLILYLGTALTAAAMGGILPLLCEVAAEDQDAGPAVARVLLANVVGATAGPLLTGFVLLEIETLQHAILIVTLLGLFVAQGLWWADRHPVGRGRGVIVGMVLAGVSLLLQPWAHTLFLEKIHFGETGHLPGYRYLAQGRSGIVGVWPSGNLFGEGLYDGGFNLDPMDDVNMISRTYMVAALHPKPERILEIGLGTGSWARVLADDPMVKALDVVEIDPSYVDVIWNFPEVASVLRDPRVRLHFDDGRRWMAKHPDRRFDVIVINGTWHWRAGATHILSADFLREAKTHLAPGGVIYYNTTGSDDVTYTATGVFRHVVMYRNFLAASDVPFAMTREERRTALMRFRGPDGKPRFASELGAARVEEMLDHSLEDLAPTLRRANDLWFATDDNMATEFKSNGAGAWWRALPARLWRPERAWPDLLF